MTIQHKNTTETKATTKALLTLATINNDDGLSSLLSTSSTSPAAAALSVALARKREKEKESAVEQAADEIISLVKQADSSIEELRDTYRQLRQQMKTKKNAMTDIAVARMYGEETMNFLPLQMALKKAVKSFIEIPEGKENLFKVPEDFAAKALAKLKLQD